MLVYGIKQIASAPFFGKHISSTSDLHYGLALLADCTDGSYSSTAIIFDNFLAFNFPFFQVQTIISTSFFLTLSIGIPPFSML